MLALFQIAALCILLAFAGLWWSWVDATQIAPRVPSQIGEVAVVGGDAAQNASVSKALIVGVASVVAEHRRDIDMINRASRLRDRPGVAILDRVSTPVPGLLKAYAPPADLGLKIEAFGSSVDAKGLRGFIESMRPSSALQLTLLLDPSVDPAVTAATQAGLVTSSFDGDEAFGFSLPVSGSTSDIARMIAMRYLQALYARSDRFAEAATPEDFRLFWQVRKDAALIARRRAISDPADPDDSQQIATRNALGLIAPLASRYPDWSAVSRVNAYLASVAGDYRVARNALLAARQSSSGRGDEAAQITRALAGLSDDVRDKVATRASEGLPRVAGVFPGIVDQPALVAINAPRIIDEAAARGDPVRVGIVLAVPAEFPQFKGRIETVPLGAAIDPANVAHASSIVGLIAGLAPKASIRVAPVIDALSRSDEAAIVAGLDSLFSKDWKPEIVFIGLGPLRGELIDAALRRHAATTLFVLPAGNTRESVALVAAKLGTVLYVGAHTTREGERVRTDYSNYGPDVALYAPGTILSYKTPAELGESSGTSLAAAVATAAAANLRSLKPALPVSRLKAQLLADAYRLDPKLVALRFTPG